TCCSPNTVKSSSSRQTTTSPSRPSADRNNAASSPNPPSRSVTAAATRAVRTRAARARPVASSLVRSVTDRRTTPTMSLTNSKTTRIVRSITGTDRVALVAGGVAAVCLLGAFVGFLVGSSLTAVFVVGFLITVGYGWYTRQALTAKGLTFLATVSTLLTMGLIIVFVLREALPAVRYMGPIDLLSFTGEPMWRTGGEQLYSLAPAIVGTLVETLLAVAIARPLDVAGALFVSDVAPGWLPAILTPGIEILAGIPSIVLGYLGLVVLTPYFASSSAFGLPGLGSLLAV